MDYLAATRPRNSVMRGISPHCADTPCCRYGWMGALVLLLVADVVQAQLRVVNYNTTGPPWDDTQMAVVLRSIGEESRNGIAKPIDILLLQEQGRVSGLPDTQAFVTLLNSMYTGQMHLGMPITYARGTLVPTFGDTTQSIVYRTQTVDLLGEASVGTSGGANPQPRATVRHQVRPDGYTSADAWIYIYNSHYKAGDEADDPANLLRRNTEATAIRTNSNNLGNVHAMYAGDLNLYTAGEPAFQTLLASGVGMAGYGKAEDPLGLTEFDDDPGTFLNGEWHNNFASSFSHTQSPCSSSINGCGTSGGMDDRFDFQLVTEELTDHEGLSLIDGSYHAFGNGGGFCCNSSITSASNPVTFPGVTSHTKTTILTALRDVTDHIPVVADYQVPAVLSAIAGAVPPTLNVGEVFNLEVTVHNAANVVAPHGADELDYSVTTSGDLVGSYFNQMDLALGGANVHQIQLDTSTAGLKNGTIFVQSASQAAQNAMIEIPISFEVLDPVLDGDFNGDGEVDAGDYVRWRNHLGDPDEAGINFAGDGNDVALSDYTLWKANYGTPGTGGLAHLAPGKSPGANYPVPEPSGWLMMAVGCCLAAGRLGKLRAWNQAK